VERIIGIKESRMSDKQLYRIADSTVIEPLINKWAVWSDLISPLPYSLHLVNYQMKTLASYLKNPLMHVKACRDPKFAGGPFVDVPAHRAHEVKELLDNTEKSQSGNINFAAEAVSFYNVLAAEAKGQSLEPYYQRVPGLLRGYVELLYDYYNHPILRFLESLLYESPYYQKRCQSLRVFEQKLDNCRRSFLSTPRLEEDDQIDWPTPFDAPEVDEFFKAEHEPVPLGQMQEILNVNPVESSKLSNLLTAEPCPPRGKWTGPGVRIRYYGHACLLIEWNGISVLTDPWIGVNSTQREVERFSYNDLCDQIDFVLITHCHHDHFVPESLLRLRYRVGCIVVPRAFGLLYTDPSLKLMARKIGFKNVIELDAFESIKLDDGEIIACPFIGEHADLAHGKTAYVIRAGKQQILIAADSNCLEPRMYEHVRDTLGPIETTFLGMECVGAPLSWLYGALLPSKLQHSHDQSRRTRACNSSSALELLKSIESKRVYVYAMGSEPWLQYSMGLGLSKDSVQIQQSDKLITTTREKGFVDSQRLFGKFELHLN
jgi:L-ascorbate metabolism protein UlaG (beta-lactamase superfamily)